MNILSFSFTADKALTGISSVFESRTDHMYVLVKSGPFHLPQCISCSATLHLSSSDYKCR